MIIGIGYYSYCIGNINQLISDYDASNEELVQKMDSLKYFHSQNHLPILLLNRIKKHIESTKDQKKFVDSEKFLQLIPTFYRDQVVAKTHVQVFAKVWFFQDKSKYFINSFVHELKPVSLSASEVLYLQGDDATEIYFISKGRIKLVVDLHAIITDPYLIRKMRERE